MKNTHLRAPKKHYMWIAIIGVILVTLIFYRLAGPISPHLLLLTSTGVVTFLLYGFDKVQAKNDGGRVPEITLLLLILAGGFIGGWAGSLIFRHKIRKPIFLAMLFLATILHILYIVCF
jgi:uncharacterized membrane protein YsdA (DUF1294 family)